MVMDWSSVDTRGPASDVVIVRKYLPMADKPFAAFITDGAVDIM